MPATSSPARTTQMNVRIDAALKASGDAALADAGATPSSAVRSLWSFAAAHADEPQVIADFLSDAQSDAAKRRGEQRAERLALVQAGPHAVDSFRQRAGVAQAPATANDLPIDELLYEALTDRERQRSAS